MFPSTSSSLRPVADQAPALDPAAQWVPHRRMFLKAMGALAGSAGAFGLAGCGGASAQSVPTTAETLRAQLMANEAFWSSVQARFMLNPQKLFMNIGTAGAMPTTTVEKFNAENVAYAVESKSGYSNFLTERTAIARGTGTLEGRGFGVEPDELVMSYNTSDGMSKSILGIPWQQGDVIITTNHEHPGGDVPLGIAVERYGVVVRRIKLPVGDGQVMLADGTMATHNAELYRTLFRNEVVAAQGAGQRVRAIMWSSPTYLTGIMLPIREIVSVCREFNLISICDGAHLPGMMAYNYGDLGVDFMSGAGHKWQCGPGSTGILIVRNRARPNAASTLPPYYPVVSSSANTTRQAGARPYLTGSNNTATVPWTQRGDYDIGSAIQSIGSMHVPLFQALAASCADWDAIGRKNIETYVTTMAAYTKARIVEIWGSAEALHAPRDMALGSALTSFNPFYGIDGGRNLIRRSTATNASTPASPSSRLVTRLGTERNIVIRNTTVPRLVSADTTVNEFPLRISTHLWHDPNDVDRMLEAVRALAVEIAASAT
ncbi:aminotransferase class V-fold PLP-dependent enzyme [Ramlibacter tataouinensis]|uniref:Sulfurtransferases-like protein n=1 Tax=Ramlibacter tataouinensis (strain ATCC BAA-407 / DSM 14655 / LMG 21543 / TTB310) TaxID=365046 RepID=F5XXH8_RAMTT|nr:aminotransferase class V-fold PLP-dependent enzyme [Ramlibacter tataouinensis]AEG94313.1 sulfurtransferases-like protein [Ramlibacter tataouinensis TTB310]